MTAQRYDGHHHNYWKILQKLYKNDVRGCYVHFFHFFHASLRIARKFSETTRELQTLLKTTVRCGNPTGVCYQTTI